MDLRNLFELKSLLDDLSEVDYEIDDDNECIVVYRHKEDHSCSVYVFRFNSGCNLPF